jgi:hypothetical protein
MNCNGGSGKEIPAVRQAFQPDWSGDEPGPTLMALLVRLESLTYMLDNAYSA